MPLHEITVPELEMPDEPITLSAWLAGRGSRVDQREPVVEILAGVATVDLCSPVDGVLIERLVAVDEPIQVGQRLAVIEAD